MKGYTLGTTFIQIEYASYMPKYTVILFHLYDSCLLRFYYCHYIYFFLLGGVGWEMYKQETKKRDLKKDERLKILESQLNEQTIKVSKLFVIFSS